MVDTLKRLPTDVEKGTVGGDTFNTNIPPRASSGHEQRTIEWDQCLYKGDVGYGVRTESDLEHIIIHHRRCRGRARSFPFRDPGDYKATLQRIGTGNGSTATFQLVKRYLVDENTDNVDDEGLEYTRTILLPVSGTVLIYVAASLKTEGLHYSVDYTTGIVTFHGSPGQFPTTGQAITATFEFDKPCRWDVDQLKISMIMIDLGQIPAMPIIEVID